MRPSISTLRDRARNAGTLSQKRVPRPNKFKDRKRDAHGRFEKESLTIDKVKVANEFKKTRRTKQMKADFDDWISAIFVCPPDKNSLDYENLLLAYTQGYYFKAKVQRNKHDRLMEDQEI